MQYLQKTIQVILIFRIKVGVINFKNIYIYGIFDLNTGLKKKNRPIFQI